MTWDGVPYVISKTGAEHGPDVMRVLAYAAVNGAEGVVGVDDCKVVPLNVPGSGFRVSAGAVVVLNKAAGAGLQTYVARNPDDDTVMFTPTGSGGGRTDLVAAVIEDPYYAGQPTPTDVVHGPYVRTKLYTNVPSTVTKLSDVDPNQTGYALAKYTLGASDGTLDAADIVDLRRQVRPASRQTNGGVNFTAGTATAASLTVPAGRWTFMAKGRFNWSMSTGPNMTAILNSSAAGDLDTYTHGIGGNTGTTSFALLWTGDLTAGATISVKGSTAVAGNGTQLMDSVRLTAVPG